MLCVTLIPPQMRITMRDYLYSSIHSFSIDDPSFYDYFFVNEDTFQPESFLLSSYLNLSKESQTSEMDSTMAAYIIPQLALVCPLRFMIWRSLNYLPSVLNYLKHVHEIDRFIQFLQTPPQVNMTYQQLLEPFTAKDMWQSFNYDILETYGDSWIK